MRDMFRGYYKPTREEFDALWEECTFTLDANVLLDLYRYSEATRAGIIHVLRRLSDMDRLWLSHQAALEYHRNRLDAIVAQIGVHSRRREDLEKVRNTVEQDLRSSVHPSLDEDLLGGFIAATEDIEAELAKNEAEQRDLLSEDTIADEIAEIFDGRVGNELPASRLIEIYEEGKQRYPDRVPPGYCDEKKPEPERYGDLVLWLQIIEQAETTNKPMILITNEGKEDWWLKIEADGRIWGPRPELIEEIQSKADVAFYMYRLNPFMKLAEETLNIEVPGEAISEIGEISELGGLEELRMHEQIEAVQRQFRQAYTPPEGLLRMNEQIEALQRQLQQACTPPEGLLRLNEQIEALQRQFRQAYTPPEGLLRMNEQIETLQRQLQQACTPPEGLLRLNEQIEALQRQFRQAYTPPEGLLRMNEQIETLRRQFDPYSRRPDMTQDAAEEPDIDVDEEDMAPEDETAVDEEADENDEQEDSDSDD